MTEHTNNLDTVLPQHELLQDKSFIKKIKYYRLVICCRADYHRCFGSHQNAASHGYLRNGDFMDKRDNCNWLGLVFQADALVYCR